MQDHTPKDKLENAGNSSARKKYDAQLSQLQAGLDEATHKNKRGRDAPSSSFMQQGMAMALRIGIELVVAVIVGIAIGYFLDKYLNTTPFLMILMSFMGLAAGISNIYRLTKGYHMGVGYRKKDEKLDKNDKI